MDLVSVYYRYHVTPEVDEYVKYNAESINIDTMNKTITAELNLTFVDIQHLGLYECYARSLPADLYIDPDDSYYEVGQNTSLVFPDKTGTYFCLGGVRGLFIVVVIIVQVLSRLRVLQYPIVLLL